MKKRKLVIENGLVFSGRQFGADTEGVFELVFNTAMAGYQEIISDPAYCDSIVVMSYPLIGSYGITDEDYESRMMTLGGMVVREYIDQPSNFRYTKTLSETFEENGVAGLCGVDTRRIVRVIRDCGTMKAMITDEDTPLDAALGKLRSYVMPTDQVARCSCRKRRYARTQNHRFTVAVIDCGAKLSIIRELNERGCNVVILPYDTTAEQLRGIRPDGVVFSNGPGSPENIPQTSLLVKEASAARHRARDGARCAFTWRKGVQDEVRSPRRRLGARSQERTYRDDFTEPLLRGGAAERRRYGIEDNSHECDRRYGRGALR